MSDSTIIQLDSVSQVSLVSNKNHELQFIPASIDHNGPQEIDTYFTKFIEPNDSKGCLEVSLLGRPLEGEIVKPPEGFECVVLQVGQGNGLGGSREGGKTMRAIKRLDGFTYWNYDRVPSNEDQLKQAMQWITLANVLHNETDE